MASSIVPRRRSRLAQTEEDRTNQLAVASDNRVYQHALAAWERSQADQIDSQTTRDAIELAFDEECGLYDHGISKANGSTVKQRLLADKLEALASINNHRIARRFSRP